MDSAGMRANILLLITAGIWGAAFSAQKIAMASMGPLTFNAIRFALGTSVLLPIIIYLDKKNPHKKKFKKIFLPGILLGILIFTASYLQQLGICSTTAGKSGFLTGMYVIQVPILGLLFKQKSGLKTWIGVLLALCGSYFLSVTEDFTINHGDLLVLLGSTFWSLHVIAIGIFSPGLQTADAIKMSCIQFLSCAVFSLVTAIFAEQINITAIMGCTEAIIYAGVFSVGIAFTLQIVAQRDAQPTAAVLILCTEGIFAAVAGWFFLNETMETRTILGCILIFFGMIFAQLKFSEKKYF